MAIFSWKSKSIRQNTLNSEYFNCFIQWLSWKKKINRPFMGEISGLEIGVWSCSCTKEGLSFLANSKESYRDAPLKSLWRISLFIGVIFLHLLPFICIPWPHIHCYFILGIFPSPGSMEKKNVTKGFQAPKICCGHYSSSMGISLSLCVCV